MKARRHRWLTGLAVALVLFAAVVVLFDWNWLQDPLERRVSAQTGREFSIEDLHVRPGLTTRIRLRGVRFANADWADEAQMAQIDEAEFGIRLGPLLRGALVFPEIRLARPQIHLARNEQGAGNWTLARDETSEPEEAKTEDGAAPVIGRLIIDEGQLSFSDPAQDTAVRLAVQTVAGPDPGLQLRAEGRFRGNDVVAEAAGDPVLSLADTASPYAFDAQFRIGPTQGTAKGSVTGLTALAAADVLLDVKGDSLAELYPLLPLSLPASPPYHIKGRLLRDGEFWRFHDFAGTVGDSDLSGDADILVRDGRVRVEATLVSKLLDFNDLGGLIGAPPGTGAGETASPEQQRAAREAAAKPTLLPDKAFNFERLRAMDAAVRFKGQRIRGSRTPLDDLELELVLQDGVLKTRPLNFGVAGGNVISTMTLDARRQPARLQGDFEVKALHLDRLFPQSEMAGRSAGVIGGRAVLRGEGNSFADLLGTADGTLGLVMTGGRVSNLMLEAVGLDAAEILRFLFRGDKTVPLRCAVADFAMIEGVLQTRSVVVDTDDTKISAEGRINLRDEALDLTLHPLPKDYSPLALRSPLHINGSFKDPDVGLDDSLLLKGGVAAVLAAVAAPLAALVPLIETGPGKDADCAELTEAVARHAGTPAPPPAPARPER